MYGIILILVIIVMGGAVAYIGDKLGTKVGKKKLSIFGLRPKHTSIIVTIITGILIAASTLGVLAMTSRDVRTALFGMEALKAQLANLSLEVSAKNTELTASRAELEAKTAEYATLNARIKDTAAKLAAISLELAEVAAERDRTATALQQVQADYTLARGDLEKARRQIQTLQATKTQLDEKVNALNQAKTALQSDVDRLNDLTAKLNQGIQVVREGSIMYRAGEVLATAVIPGGQPGGSTEKALAAVVLRTNHDILAKLGIKDQNTEALWIAKSDFDQAVSSMATAPQDVIVRISSVGNIVYGEPVIGHIDLFPNHLVYGQGQVVYTETLDAGRNSREAEETVILFLQKVNAVAIKQGILPDPLQGTVGVMSGAQLYDTVNKVNRYYGKIQLTAVATSNIYAADPLKIDIQVRSAK